MIASLGSWLDAPHRARSYHVDVGLAEAYRSYMKQNEPDAGATLLTFLDVADQLYEQVGEALARVGLSYPKYELLAHLRDEGSPVSLGCLAEDQSCARSNITQLVDRLEKDGLVRRVPDPDDRRSVKAELTESGAERVREGATQLEVVLAKFAAAFSTPERAELGRLLGRLR